MRETTVRRNPAHASLVALARAIMPTMKWRHHGIGALQGYVHEGDDPEIRIHIWSKDLVKAGIHENGDAHNHRFDMTSHVLIGQIVHEEFDIEPSSTGEYTTMEVTHARKASGNNFHGPTSGTAKRYTVRRHMGSICAGNFYTFPAGLFHRNIVSGEITITCVEKHNQREDIRAEVMHKFGSEPVMAFGHEIDKNLISRVFNEAMVAISEKKR